MRDREQVIEGRETRKRRLGERAQETQRGKDSERQ